MSKSPTDQRGRRLSPTARHRLQRERQQLAAWRRNYPGQTPDPEGWEFASELGLVDDPFRHIAKPPAHVKPKPPDELTDDDDDDDLRPPRRRHYSRVPDPEDADEFEDYDEEPEEALLDHLVNIDHQRQQLNLQRQSLQELLDFYPELASRWKEFTGLGGVSASDFRQYLAGQWRPRITRQRKHLRLVINRRQKPIIISAVNNSDPAA